MDFTSLTLKTHASLKFVFIFLKKSKKKREKEVGKGNGKIGVGNEIVVLLHRVKSETRSEKNSPPKLSRLLEGANHHRSRRSWSWSIEFCFLTPLLLTRIVVCLFVKDKNYKYDNDWWLTNTTLRSELESRDWKVNHRAVTQNHFLMKAFCLYYGQNHFCSWQPSIFEVISLF